MAVIGGSERPGTAVLDRAVALVAESLEAIGQSGSPGSAADLRARLVTLERLGRMVEAAVIDVAAECERTVAYRDDGHVSVRNWIAAETNTSSFDALARMRCARLATNCPQILDALTSGRVGVAQIRELGRVRANPRIGERVEAVIDEMLHEAATRPLHGFIALVREWESLVDADGSHRDHEAAHAKRKLRGWRRDDEPGGHLFGDFGADQFAEILEILDRYADAELLADLDDARAHGDGTPLARTADQRRVDALVQALRDAAASQTPSADATPTVNYLATADIIEEAARALIEGRTPDFDTTSLRDQLCMTTNGVPVDPTVVVAAMLVGHIRRVVIDAAGRIIDVGRRRRLFTGAGREAVALQALIDNRDGRCIWPGCGRRRQLQTDHTTEHQHGGSTDVCNGGLLCGPHNRFKSHGYTIWRDPSGHWHTYRPNGTEIGATA